MSTTGSETQKASPMPTLKKLHSQELLPNVKVAIVASLCENSICHLFVRILHASQYTESKSITPVEADTGRGGGGGGGGGVEMKFTINFHHKWTQQYHIWSKLIVNIISTPPPPPPPRLYPPLTCAVAFFVASMYDCFCNKHM